MPAPFVPPEGGSLKSQPLMGLADPEHLPHLSLPNLDDLDLDTAQAFKDALGRVRHYCTFRIFAHQARIEGRMQDALEFEQFMQGIYNGLPESWRW